MKKKELSMKITFDGQQHSIDANTLINVLLHYRNVIDIANREYGGGTKNIALRINAIEKGSFVIDISLAERLVNIFSNETVQYISELCTIIGTVYTLYKLKKGKPVKDNEEVNINLGDNSQINTGTIINIYNQQVTREAISKSIETSQSDCNVEGISFDSGKGKTTTFNRDEFAEYIYTDFDKEELPPEDIAEEVETILTITTLSFEKGSKWAFLWNGIKISMVVKDDALMKEIDNGARFGKGDAIKVKLRIVKRFNPDYNAYENKSYKIVEFLDLIPSSKQGKLF